jgi:hypothetical protein
MNSAMEMEGYSPDYSRFVLWSWLGLKRNPIILQQTGRTDTPNVERGSATVENAFSAIPPGGTSPCAVLLTGPAGTGKTTAVQKVAASLPNLRTINMTPQNTGEAAEVLEHFAAAASCGAQGQPCLIFVDDAHVIFPVSEGAAELDLLARTLVSSIRLLRTDQATDASRGGIMVVLATNVPQSVTPHPTPPSDTSTAPPVLKELGNTLLWMQCAFVSAQG